MPIHLVTGTPGAGKTLLALRTTLELAGVKWRGLEPSDMAQQLADTDRADYRPVYVCGVEGIREDVFNVIDDPLTWQDLPDGSIVLIDEVWKWFDQPHVKNDARVKDLAVHRHRGFDFVMTTQFPNQIIPHVRALVSPHFHLIRQFGANVASWYSWPSLEMEANSPGKKELAERRMFNYPKEIFSLYSSATQHTIKRRLPRKLKIAAAAAVLLPIAGFFALKGLSGILNASAVVDSPGGPGESAPQVVVTSQDWLERFDPRVDWIPASAPAFDELTVPQRVPRPLCVAVGDWPRPSGCFCHDQDGNSLDMGLSSCLKVVRSGFFEAWREPERS